MTIKSWSSGSLRVEYSDSWVANGGNPVHLSLSRRSGDTVTLALSLAEVGALINLLGDAAAYVAAVRRGASPNREQLETTTRQYLRGSISSLDERAREAVARFNMLPQEKQMETWKHQGGAFLELVQAANERFEKLTPEQKDAHRRAQRKSWCRGEFFLAHPEKTEDDFNAIWGRINL